MCCNALAKSPIADDAAQCPPTSDAPARPSSAHTKCPHEKTTRMLLQLTHAHRHVQYASAAQMHGMVRGTPRCMASSDAWCVALWVMCSGAQRNIMPVAGCGCSAVRHGTCGMHVDSHVVHGACLERIWRLGKCLEIIPGGDTLQAYPTPVSRLYQAFHTSPQIPPPKKHPPLCSLLLTPPCPCTTDCSCRKVQQR